MTATLRHSMHHAPLAVRCRTCRRPAGWPCTAGGVPIASFHEPRKADLPKMTPEQKEQLIGMILDLQAVLSDATQAEARTAEIKVFLNSL